MAGRSSDVLSALFGFALMTAYWPGIAGVATTPRWDIAALLALPLFFAPQVRMTAAHWTGLALVAWLLLTLAWDESRLDGVDAGAKLIVAGVAFAWGSTLRSLKPVVIGAALGVGVNSVVALFQTAGMPLGIETFANGYAGLFFNRDRLGAVAALVAVGVIAFRMAPLLICIAPSLILTQSRAAWLAVAAGLLSIPVRDEADRVKMNMLRILAIVAAFLTVVWRAADPSVDDRVALWHDTLRDLTWFGHGLGSFYESFPAHARQFAVRLATERPDHPHSEWLSFAWDGGAVAVVLFCLLGVMVWRATDHGLRATISCLAVLCLFAMPLHDPATLVLGSCTAGFLAGLGDRLRRAALGCGSPLCEDVAARVFARRHA